MKQQHFIIQVLLVILSGGFVSCSESDPYVDSLERKYFNVSSSNITLNSGEESASLYVGTNTNCDWYVSSTDSWIHIKNMYYSGWEDVSFTVDYNYETYTRYGRIEVYIDKPIDYKYSIPITQEPTPLAEMETTYYTSSGDSHPLTVTASSSQSWTIKRKDSDSWVHLNSSNNISSTYSGSGTKSVLIYVDKNTGGNRSATLTVTCGSVTKIINITQKPPFRITSVKTANIDYNGNIINDYGTKIYSYQTRYLSPKIYITDCTAGTYTIYTKLYTPSGALSQGSSSPSGYTFKTDITIYSYSASRELTGWGSNTAGHWKQGSYKWEFYLDGVKIGEESFSIY